MTRIFRILFAIAAFATVACSPTTPEDEIRKTIDAIYEAVNSKDIADLRTCLFIPEGSLKVFNACIRGVVDDYAEKGGIKEVFVREVITDEMTPDKAQVRYSIRLGNGAVESYEAEMVRIDGKWKKMD